jgi:hypothetical protein
MLERSAACSSESWHARSSCCVRINESGILSSSKIITSTRIDGNGIP